MPIEIGRILEDSLRIGRTVSCKPNDFVQSIQKESFRIVQTFGSPLNPKKGPCLDIDECTGVDGVTHECDNSAANNPNYPDDVTTECHNLDGTYECYCLNGYERRKGFTQRRP